MQKNKSTIRRQDMGKHLWKTDFGGLMHNYVECVHFIFWTCNDLTSEMRKVC